MAKILLKPVPDKKSSDTPKGCEGRGEPRRATAFGEPGGAVFEFEGATEEELAFWNELDDREKLELSKDAFKRCFFEALRDRIKKNQEQAEEQREKSPQTDNTPPSPLGRPPINPPGVP